MNDHRKGEKGFTLAEVITSLMIFGLVLSFVVPIYQNLKKQSDEHIIEVEAQIKLQEKLENILADSFENKQDKGNEFQRSKIKPNLTYQLHWYKKLRRTGLWQIHVEVQWEDPSKRKRKLNLQTSRYIPI
ncbi:type II secretion system protein [Thermoflavimicrobium daqui]|jgi:prepilin-type N-terminal cleavage/methylation domain-containing protein|uniref:Prepilin-type N-terminal cleavage/methylation domain-containing protein n=1 Tax=Thermoflavimicrobium daqui TaxID=2137476 RepID=A0A364K6I4_9BACL|nr:type II secretion system protein [Thermoflavimicrobium daqui]RAL25919.1 hypothetical protein DL897_07535 [Thermoflavimicrobium daqui]